MDCSDPAGMRLDLAKPVGLEAAQPGHPVLAAAALQLVQPGQLALVAGDDQLAAPLERDAALPAVLVQLARALDAEPRLQRPGRVVDPRVDDAAVVPRLVLRHGVLALEHDHARVRAAPLQLARHREPEDSRRRRPRCRIRPQTPGREVSRTTLDSRPVQSGNGKRALVTGAAGFIGSHVADGCLELGMEVVATDDLSGGFRENVPDGAQWIEGDLRDAAFVASLWDGGQFDYVYHLGAYAAEGLSHFIRAFNYRTNLEASVNLINQAVLGEAERFVFTSSIAVYGAGQLPMSESMVPQPEDPYGISKYAVELDLAAAHNMFDLDYTVFRPHNVYGERQNIADRYRNVIGIFMNNVLQEKPMPVFGDGLQTRAFSHVVDVAPVISRSPARAGVGERGLQHRRRHALHDPRARGGDRPGLRRRGGHRAPRRHATRSCTLSPTTPRCARTSSHLSRSTCAPGSSAWPHGCATTARATRSTSRARSRSIAGSRRPGASRPAAEPSAGRAPRLALVFRELLRRSPGARPPPLRP